MKRNLFIATGLFMALMLQFLLTTPAHAAAIVWSGATDLDLATATNWVGGVAPVDGDTLVFDSDVYDYSSYDTVLNNSTLTTIAGVTLQGANNGSVDITGNDLIITADVTDSATGSLRVTFDLNATLGASISADAGFGTSLTSRTLSLGAFTLTLPTTSAVFINSVVSGAGGITIDGVAYLYAANTYSGVTSIGVTGVVNVFGDTALGATGGATTVATPSGGSSNINVCFNSVSTMTIAEDITIGGGATNADIGVFGLCGVGSFGSGLPVPTATATFTGAVTLSADSIIKNYPVHVVFDNLVLGGSTLTQEFSSIGDLTVNGTKQTPPAMDVQTVAAGDDQLTTLVAVVNNQQYVINGSRGGIYVYAGGTLTGTGTVGALQVFLDGTLAPGLSPGCLSSGNLTLAGNFDVEIDGATVCTQYDQVDVTGTVDVTGGTLNILKLASYDPAAAGVTFIIINNDGADAVVGTFTGLAEGATTAVDGVTYTVSYAGGDGNDVTLTVAQAATTPTAPDTGFSSVAVNFMFIGLATLLTTSGMVIAGRKLQ